MRVGGGVATLDLRGRRRAAGQREGADMALEDIVGQAKEMLSSSEVEQGAQALKDRV